MHWHTLSRRSTKLQYSGALQAAHARHSQMRRGQLAIRR